MSLEKRLVKKLIKKKMKISTAESCTGGLVSEKITSVAGSSECFDVSVVTYSNEQKMKVLGVSEESLSSFGAVSEEVALQMSEGVKNLSGADFAIGITGIAGPGGGTDDKPVGLVYISICTDDEHKAFGYIFEGNRKKVRESAANMAIKLVLERIK